MEERLLNDWKVLDKNDDGGFSTIYKVARDDGFICAIKKLSLPLPQDKVNVLVKNGLTSINDINNYVVSSFQREIEIMKRFNGNPNIVNLYDVSQESKDSSSIDYFIRMEYAEDLKSYFSRNAISHDDVVKMAIDVCLALELLSKNNIAHCDIKPNNIFICDGRYKLGDFGSAIVLGSNNNTSVFGTVNYMAPEVYRKENISFATDLYSLGLVMYTLLKGDLPFVAKNTSLDDAFNIRMNGTSIPEIEGVNRDLMAIINKACAFNPNNRYTSAAEMRQDLLNLKGVSIKKNAISFVSNAVESTISIYDSILLSSQDSSNIIKEVKGFSKFKKKFFKLRYLKRVIGVAVVILVVSLFGKNYFLNKSCAAGYINRNGKCVKGYYYCTSGYTLNSKNQCQKTIESKDATVVYTCKTGYVLSGDFCVNKEAKDVEFTYQCADGFTLNGTKCERVESADAIVTYSCPTGYVASGSQCVTVTNVAATKNYTCSDSTYTLSGTSCTKTITKTSAASSKLTCDGDATLNGTVCETVTDPTYSSLMWWMATPTCETGTYNYSDGKCHSTVTAKTVYYCTVGDLDSSGKCKYTTTDTQAAVIGYTCPSGYTAVGSQCAKTTGISGTVKYTCGDSATLKGSKCYTTISTDAVGVYACPDGYVASGANCYQDEFLKAVKKYSCSKVYTLNGGKCEKYETVSAKAHYE